MELYSSKGCTRLFERYDFVTVSTSEDLSNDPKFFICSTYFAINILIKFQICGFIHLRLSRPVSCVEEGRLVCDRS